MCSSTCVSFCIRSSSHSVHSLYSCPSSGIERMKKRISEFELPRIRKMSWNELSELNLSLLRDLMPLFAFCPEVIKKSAASSAWDFDSFNQSQRTCYSWITGRWFWFRDSAGVLNMQSVVTIWDAGSWYARLRVKEWVDKTEWRWRRTTRERCLAKRREKRENRNASLNKNQSNRYDGLKHSHSLFMNSTQTFCPVPPSLTA